MNSTARYHKAQPPCFSEGSCTTISWCIVEIVVFKHVCVWTIHRQSRHTSTESCLFSSVRDQDPTSITVYFGSGCSLDRTDLQDFGRLEKARAKTTLPWSNVGKHNYDIIYVYMLEFSLPYSHASIGDQGAMSWSKPQILISVHSKMPPSFWFVSFTRKTWLDAAELRVLFSPYGRLVFGR